MKHLVTTALTAAALTATGVQAENHASAMDGHANASSVLASDRDNLIRTRDITGGNVYTANAADDSTWDTDLAHDVVGDNWNDIGEIEDIILSKDGQVKGIVAEVGGFLDIADKHVVIAVEDLNLVAVDDRSYAYVTRFTEEELESMEGVDEGFWN